MYKPLSHGTYKHRRVQHSTAPLITLGGLAVLCVTPAWAQVVPDGTITPVTTVDTGVTDCPGTCIRGGLNTDLGSGNGNLFHSFSTFTIPSGTVTFQDPGNVANIIGRVTGGSPSFINGTLRVADTGNSLTNTNLFLFNPNGITFGSGATLQLGGSFIASTASGIQFDNGSFSLTDNSAALLEVNVPTGLQVGTGAGDIVVNGTGNNLSINGDTSLDQSNRPLGLQVGSSQTLALVGNNVTLAGGNLTANDGATTADLQNNAGGRIEIGGVQFGTVSLSSVTDGWTLGYGGTTLGNVTLTNDGSVDSVIGTPNNGSSINVSGSSVGTVRLQGAQVSFLNGSSIIANTLDAGTGGLVEINATDLIFAGISAEALAPPPPPFPVAFTTSGIFANVDVGASGSGSQVNLNVTNLSITGGAQVSAGTFGSGQTGQLRVDASGNVAVSGGSPAGPSGLFASVQSGSTADNSGDLDLVINADSLSLTDGGQVSVGSFGPGNAGNLQVNATNQIEVLGSFGSPPAGGPSSIRSASETSNAGAGGNVTVNTSRLLVADGGQIVTGTLSSSNAGDLTVRASEIELRGGDAFGQSGLIASALDTATSGTPNLTGTGTGGNIIVEAGNLFIRDGATIRASNTPTGGNPNLSQGLGPAGDVRIIAQNVTLDNGSTLAADTNTNVVSSDGRNASVTINAQTLTLNNSRITTNATGTVAGGNVTANLNTLTMLNGSAITADSVNSAGGRITINTAILALAPDSTITARSGLGADFDGVVEVNETEGEAPEAQVGEAAPEDTQELIASCEKLTENELVLTGAGGVPADPTAGLTSQNIWVDTRAAATDSIVLSAPEPAQLEDEPLTIVAAQGWATNDQGQLVLVAEPTVAAGETFVASHQSQYCGRG